MQVLIFRLNACLNSIGMKKVKLVLGVIGSRSFSDWEKLLMELEEYLPFVKTIVSGGASGADRLAERWAEKNGLDVVLYLPDFSRYGRGAYRERNKKIVEVSDFVVAFWDGRSKGTKMTLNYCNSYEKPYRIIAV